MRKIIFILAAMAVVASCSQSRKWTDKEREEVRELVRNHRDRVAIRHMEESNYQNLEQCVLTTIEETYPDYNQYNKLTGKTDGFEFGGHVSTQQMSKLLDRVEVGYFGKVESHDIVGLVFPQRFDCKSLKVTQSMTKERSHGRNQQRFAEAARTRQKELAAISANVVDEIGFVYIDLTALA